MNLYTEKDAKPVVLKGAKLAMIGYGSQGRAHALNAHDSGLNVVVGVRKGGAGWDQAQRDGLQVAPPAEACKDADLVAVLVPDMVQPAVFKSDIEPNLKPGSALLFAHGFCIHYKQIEAPEEVDVILVAPKGPGDLVRRQYEEGRGVPCLQAVHRDATGKARDRALAYAHAIGGTRGGVLDTTFAEETETDLFGEQAVLCGGATELVVRGFETLVDAGYQPEVAYFECLHELKLIVDLLYEGGLKKMHDFISDTALYGDLKSGPRVIDEHAQSKMRDVLKDIQDGTFAQAWIDEFKAGSGEFDRLKQEDLDHNIEKVGAQLRGRMAWLNSGKSETA